jgi:predicted SprT family Zn-dependent metalloprotease
MWLIPSQLHQLSGKLQRRTTSSQRPRQVQQLIPQKWTHIIPQRVFFTTASSSSEDATAVKSNDAGDVTLSFRRNRESLAQHWLTEFDTVAFGGRFLQSLGSPKVSLKWSNRLRTTAGRAHLMRETTRRLQGLIEPRRTAVIELSSKVVDDVDRLQITLLHEMCHAAAWIVDGSLRPPHGPCFQKWAQRATAAIPSIAITTKHSFKIQYKYTWACVNPACSVQIIGRHGKRSINVERHVCGKCRGPLRVVGPNTTSSSKQNEISRRPLTEYHHFIQKHSKLVALQLGKKQLDDRGTKTLLGRKKSSALRKVSPQRVMKETARLWQKQKKRTP